MKVKFKRDVVTFYGAFNANTVHDLPFDQSEQLLLLNPDDIELIADED